MSLLLIYVTFGSKKNALEASKHLIENKLVSCANILPQAQSIFMWEGEIQYKQEIVVIFKTRDVLFEEVREHIEHMHSYDVPCILALPIEKAHKPFLEWVETVTSDF